MSKPNRVPPMSTTIRAMISRAEREQIEALEEAEALYQGGGVLARHEYDDRAIMTPSRVAQYAVERETNRDAEHDAHKRYESATRRLCALIA